jgi:hypothetical protein
MPVHLMHAPPGVDSERPPMDELARIALQLVNRVDEITDRTVRRIMSSVPTLHEAGTLPLRDLWRSVAANLRGVLMMLAERRGPDTAELESWAALGRRRAQQGIPVDDVMRALRVTNTVLWETLTEAAIGAETDCAQQILERAASVWETFDAISCEVATAHRGMAGQQDIRSRRQGLELLAALTHSPAESESAQELARALGLDPSGSFVVAVHDGGRRTPPGERAVTIDLPEHTVVVVQTGSDDATGERDVAEGMSDRGVHVGVGVARPGLTGAHLSLTDARMAFQAAVQLDLGVVRFRDSWLECLALADREQHEPLVADALSPLGTDPSVRETVVAFLARDGSLAAAAADLGLHANTVAYRVRQLAERTGVDVRTTDGSFRAQVALALAGAPVTTVREAAS